jgi:hypothetical protein
LQGRYAVGSSALLCEMPAMKLAKASEYGSMQPLLFFLWFIDKTNGLVKGSAIEKPNCPCIRKAMVLLFCIALDSRHVFFGFNAEIECLPRSSVLQIDLCTQH